MRVLTILALAGFMTGLSPKPSFSDSYCTDWNTEAFFMTGTAQDVRDCIVKGEDIEHRDDKGRTPLHLAASFALDASVVAELRTAVQKLATEVA